VTRKTNAVLIFIASLPRGARFYPNGSQWLSVHALKRRGLIKRAFTLAGGYELTPAGRSVMKAWLS